MDKINSIYFHKEQRKILHKFLDVIYEYNMSIPNCECWDNYIDVHIYNEDEGTIVEFDDKIECDGFQGIDESHCVVPNGCAEYLSIDENQEYTINIGENYHMYNISGEDIMNYIRNKYNKENEKLRKDIFKNEKH